MSLKNEIEKTMFKEGIEDRIQDIATFMDIPVENVKKRLKTLSFSDYIKVMNSLKTQDKDNIERIMGMPARDPNWKSPIDDIDDEEEQHRRDVKHGLYGDDEEDDESEDDKEQHRRDVKHGLYGDDVDEGAEMHISPDIARAKTLQHTLPRIDKERYQERDGLEGPIMTKSGKVVYYDPIEGSYYDPDTDIYLSYEEWKELSEAVDFFAETVTMLAMNDGIMHYSDAKGTPKYSEGYKAAKDGVKYDENPYSGAEKLQWSKGHNDWRADELASKGEPNYGARGQFESDVESDIYAQDTMKDELPDKYKNYPGHLADLEAQEPGVSAEDLVDIITHRIKMNKELMLSLLGDEGPGPLMRAIEDVADFYSGTTEVGSSDVSAMVDAVKKNLLHVEGKQVNELEDDGTPEYGDTEEDMAKALGMSQDDLFELAERVGQDQYGGLTKDNYEDVMTHIVDNFEDYKQTNAFSKSK